MDNWLMILLAFLIGYMFKNMCGKRVEGYGECRHSLLGCAGEHCQNDDDCLDNYNSGWLFKRDKPLECRMGINNYMECSIR